MRCCLMKTALLLPFALLAAPPALAQDRSERVLLVFGDDACPRSDDPDEIVVCARSPESERFRIPKRFRGEEISPARANESWAARAESLEYAGRTGIGSCSVVGPGGWTGCYQEMLRLAAAERRASGRERRSIDGEE